MIFWCDLFGDGNHAALFQKIQRHGKTEQIGAAARAEIVRHIGAVQLIQKGDDVVRGEVGEQLQSLFSAACGPDGTTAMDHVGVHHMGNEMEQGEEGGIVLTHALGFPASQCLQGMTGGGETGSGFAADTAHMLLTETLEPCGGGQSGAFEIGECLVAQTSAATAYFVQGQGEHTGVHSPQTAAQGDIGSSQQLVQVGDAGVSADHDDGGVQAQQSDGGEVLVVEAQLSLQGGWW